MHDTKPSATQGYEDRKHKEESKNNFDPVRYIKPLLRLLSYCVCVCVFVPTMADEGYINDDEVSAEEIREVIWTINGKRYRIEQMLGSGAFGAVVMATVVDPDNSDDFQTVAIKQINSNAFDRNETKKRLSSAVTEYMIGRYLEVKTRDFCKLNAVCATQLFYNEALGFAYIFFPLADPNTLDNWKRSHFHKRINASTNLRTDQTHADLGLTWQLCVVARNFMSCVGELHKLGAAHRDLKGDNILMSQNGDYEIRLIDFAFSCVDKEALRKMGAKEKVREILLCSFERPRGFRPYVDIELANSGANYKTTIEREQLQDVNACGWILASLMSPILRYEAYVLKNSDGTPLINPETGEDIKSLRFPAREIAMRHIYDSNVFTVAVVDLVAEMIGPYRQRRSAQTYAKALLDFAAELQSNSV